eukprot:1971873-Rhodomonas_salina.1
MSVLDGPGERLDGITKDMEDRYLPSLFGLTSHCLPNSLLARHSLLKVPTFPPLPFLPPSFPPSHLLTLSSPPSTPPS